MRLKSFTSENMGMAMKMVRDQLGPEAIIVSTRRGPGGKGVRITAAIEKDDILESPPASFAVTDTGKNNYGRERENLEPGSLESALKHHGIPEKLVHRLTETAEVLSQGNMTMALAAALDETFRFSPIFETTLKRPLMLVGAPGCGKTVSIAKIATQARLKNMPVQVVTIDTFRAGGVEQLRAFMRILKISLQVAQNPDELKSCLAQSNGAALTLIDSAGTNPFISQEMDELKSNIDASNAEPVLVMSAGGDAMESAETSEAFSNLGVSRMLVTRLDLTRRLGGLLAAAEAGKLRFSDVG
ncbi:MAG: hypothetical protein HOO00_05420 [Rhodospirillaceae bacterium]|jgi:flagellar biosynthesis protein FlhF|nr:hypothetical protein [Rhodospirillaceae bacterium]MBT5375067.1 hypothetical protein [Rhodospirillaceae bacterium]MBT5659396.1 hypothetical protein [Rhodospirillaceae bacterium]MBT5753058.1 hypothetical protein [Rhodospirillaceae bacterium]